MSLLSLWKSKDQAIFAWPLSKLTDMIVLNLMKHVLKVHDNVFVNIDNTLFEYLNISEYSFYLNLSRWIDLVNVHDRFRSDV